MKNQIVKEISTLEKSIINSSLWAAAGDALGWITELSHGENGVKRRIGSARAIQTQPWERVIGGKGGVKAKLPAGAYSDDTQLRLAVSRSIREGGFFDVESFAKIELTIWPSYALGGGLGTKTAAQNLSKRTVSWFSNFFENGKQNYFTSGGNGAAMRIQPHVWSSFNKDYQDNYLLNTLRDSLVTHGHPHGFCGAFFHALALYDTIANKKIPSPKDWLSYVEKLSDIPYIIRNDSQLNTFWLSAWEENNKTSLSNSIEKIKIELLNDIDKISKLVVTSSNECYHEILDRLGCLTSKFRGSGIKTALAASALAYMYKDIGIKEALICSANELDSDTDTIATMCGAMLGAICDTHPDWAIQDKDYIITEALRLMNMGNGNAQYQAFNYPDIGNWTPPVNQIDVVGLHKNNIAMMRLGELIPDNKEEFHANNAVWQWFSLPFGQTILVKRRNIIKLELNPEQLPKEITNQFSDFEKRSQKPTISSEVKNPKSQYTLPLNNCDTHIRDNRIGTSNEKDPLDQATDDVINSNFDDLTLGRLLNSCIDSTQSIQMAVSFTAIIAKAKIVRQRRKN